MRRPISEISMEMAAQKPEPQFRAIGRAVRCRAPGCENRHRPASRSQAATAPGRLRQLRPEMILAQQESCERYWQGEIERHRGIMAAAQPRPPRRFRPVSHSATSPASGHPVTGRPPVQFGTAVSREAGQHRPEIARKAVHAHAMPLDRKPSAAVSGPKASSPRRFMASAAQAAPSRKKGRKPKLRIAGPCHAPHSFRRGGHSCVLL